VARAVTAAPEFQGTQGAENLYFLAVPLETYQALSEAAAKRGMTLAQALSKAVNDFLGAPEGPRVLTEENNGR
jgi:hypothetical protein